MSIVGQLKFLISNFILLEQQAVMYSIGKVSFISAGYPGAVQYNYIYNPATALVCNFSHGQNYKQVQ